MKSQRRRPRQAFGHTGLPPAQQEALSRAIRLEIVTFCYMLTAVAAVGLTMGSSQAMQAAWIEDLLALIPPLAFLVAVRRARKQPTAEHPYGFHRSVAVGHLTSSVALLSMGLFLVEDSVSGLVMADHPPIGTMSLFGHTFWAGWLMIAAMAYTAVGPVVLARLKLPLAEELHDKVLYSDADMQKADWMTAIGTMVGVLGIGLGLWWADATVALLIALSILRDGWTNLKYASAALMDGRARTYDNRRPHPLTEAVDRTALDLPWVHAVRTRIRDQGHVFHVEVFVVGEEPTVDRLEDLAARIRDLDWKLNDVVVMPVRELPEHVPA